MDSLLKAVLVQCKEQISIFLRKQGCFKNSVKLISPVDGASADPLRTIFSVEGLHGVQSGTTGLVYG
jgi:hypothetical protein